MHFLKEHRKLWKNTGATTAALDRTSFLANNTLIEALQQAEGQAESQMTTHMANAVSSQHSMDRKMGDLLQKMEALKQEVASIRNITNSQERHQQRDINASNHSYCWSHGYVSGTRHNSQNYYNKKQGHKEEATSRNMIGGSRDNCFWVN